MSPLTQTIEVQYFAALREHAGTNKEQLTTAAPTARELYEELRTRYDFPLEAQQLRVAINEAFSSWDAGLSEGDTVVFIPPVAGG